MENAKLLRKPFKRSKKKNEMKINKIICHPIAGVRMGVAVIVLLVTVGPREPEVNKLVVLKKLLFKYNILFSYPVILTLVLFLVVR